MARLFGALANAGAQVNTNRFKRQQYDDQQAAQAREEARRALEFKAMRDQAAAQAEDARKQRELDTTLRAYNNGFEDAPDMTKLRGAGIAMDAVTGFRSKATEYTPPEETPYETEVEGRPVRAAKMGSQYLTVGGKVLRNNRQRGANAVAQQEEAKALWDLKMKREVAQANAKAAIEARGEKAQAIEGMRGANRELVAGIAAASRPQPQEKKDLWTDGKGTYLRLGMDDPIPAGFQPVRSGGAGAGGGKPVTKGERDALSGIQEIRRLAQDAATKMEGVDNFSGPIDRRVEGFKTLVGNPNMARVEAMRAYQRLASPAARQTIGTAMTPQEIKRLDQWLPMLESTDERVIRSGVQNFFNEADAIYKERLQFMKASGINTDALEGLPAQFDAMAKVALPSAGASDRGRQPAPSPQSGGVKVPWTTKKGS